MASSSIDHLRILLDHLDGTQRAQQLEFFRAVMEAGPGAVPELDGRLPGARAPRALRQLALEASFYFPWPEWVPVLARILRYEADFAIFETGVRALGRVPGPGALDALRELMAMRQGSEFKEVLAEVLSETDPAEAFNHHLARLLEGSGNPALANEAAQRLAQVVDGSCLEPLKAVIMHPDLLVFRHALLLVARIPTAEAAEALLDLLRDTHKEVLADRALKEAVGSIRSSAPPAARATAQEALEALDPNRDHQGQLRAFYRQVVNATTDEGKAGQLLAVVTQAVDGMHLRSRRLAFAVDACAEGLAGMTAKGLMESARVLELLVESYREQTGREGLARALARVVPGDAAELHHLILDGPDGAQRAAAVEVLGDRLEEALQAALLHACWDPITDIGDRALFHLGRLESAEALAQSLMHSTVPEDLGLGLRLVAQNRFTSLVPDLLQLMKTASREELVLQAILTLGAVGAAQSGQPLLEMLHSGQSPRLQAALAQALRDLRQPAMALALCAKADELRQASLHIVAVEALAAAHPLGGEALAAEHGPLLVDQVRQAWNDRNPWAQRLRLVTALQGLQLAHGGSWQTLAEMLQDALAEKRPPTAWNPKELHQVQAAARDFGRRG